MVTFAITMVVLGLLAAFGFVIANRSGTNEEPPPEITTNEDIVCYVAAEVPAILHDALSSVPLTTHDEALTGCYGTMGPAGRAQNIHPYQTNSLDELITRTTSAVTEMENEQHIDKFTISTQKKSKTNPHVDLLAHSNEPKRVRLVRFWRTEEGFVASLAA
jgi:hypothetical protein